MKKKYFLNANIIDPQNSIEGIGGLIVGENGKIEAVGKKVNTNNIPSREKYIDLKEKYIIPGIVDMRVFVGEPGFEYKETIESGCNSAAAGGFNSVAVMPNTKTVNDTRSVTEHILSLAKKEGIINLYAIAAITKKLQGESLSEMSDLKDAGAIAFSDDGRPVMSNELMRRAFEYSKMFNLPLIQHSAVLDLTDGGCMHEGMV